MGKIWGIGVVAAVVVAAITASSAPVVQAAETAPTKQTIPAALSPFVQSFDLPASLAATKIQHTPHGTPDALVGRWACNIPMHIYYAGSASIDSRDILKELAYPVAYLRGLGYKVTIEREVAYQADYQAPTKTGDVLIIAPTAKADMPELAQRKLAAMAEFTPRAGHINSAKITVDGTDSLSSLVLLHELGHVIGLDHKDGTVMSTVGQGSDRYDAAETAAVDCR